MNKTATFEIVYDIQDARGAFRRFRKSFVSSKEARTYYEDKIKDQKVIDAFCTARISEYKATYVDEGGTIHEPKETVSFRRIAQYYRR